MASKMGREKQSPLDELFEDFFRAASGTMRSLDVQYNVSVSEQIFGATDDEDLQKEQLRKSQAWRTLTHLYNYAVNGIEAEECDGASSLVINASDVLKIASSENYWPCDAWDRIVWMGDGRYALDDGFAVHVEKLALLAGVDIRTVRNAISAGQLVVVDKRSDAGEVYIDNTSARRWLIGRRGFKPTNIKASGDGLDLDKVRRPSQFGALLVAQREQLGPDGLRIDQPGHPSITEEAIAQLETGVFVLPLDATFPLSDLYLLDRKKFLKCVMRVFFQEELEALSEADKSTGREA